MQFAPLPVYLSRISYLMSIETLFNDTKLNSTFYIREDCGCQGIPGVPGTPGKNGVQGTSGTLFSLSYI